MHLFSMCAAVVILILGTILLVWHMGFDRVALRGATLIAAKPAKQMIRTLRMLIRKYGSMSTDKGKTR